MNQASGRDTAASRPRGNVYSQMSTMPCADVYVEPRGPVAARPRSCAVEHLMASNASQPMDALDGGGVARQSTTSQPRVAYPPGSAQYRMKAQGVSVKTIEAAINGEFINLEEFLVPINYSSNVNHTEYETVLDNDNNLIHRPKKYSRKITNFDSWQQAWACYERLLIGVLGTAVHECLADYRSFMYDANKKFLWHSLSLYDYKHRLRLSTQQVLGERLAFHIPSQDLMSTLLDSTAIRTNAVRCARCRGYDHHVSSCPFPEAARPQTAARQTVSAEICLNFNRKRCSLGDRCRRRHVCKSCQGKLPFVDCSELGPCKSKTSAQA